MRILRNISPLIPALRRAVPVFPQPFRARAVGAPYLWRRIFGQDDEPALAFLGSPGDRRSRYWKYWNVADLSVENPTSRSAIDMKSPWKGDREWVAIAGEVKGNPTESEADVAADRSDDDPLPPQMHNTILMPAGEAACKPTDSEERVAADRSREDPLLKAVMPVGSPRRYC